MDVGCGPLLPELRRRRPAWRSRWPSRIAQELLRYYPGVVLKLGARGALYAGTDGERVRVPAVPVRVVDTTGAGDALCAGFLANRLSGAPAAGALQRGIELAARVVKQVGGRPKI